VDSHPSFPYVGSGELEDSGLLPDTFKLGGRRLAMEVVLSASLPKEPRNVREP